MTDLDIVFDYPFKKPLHRLIMLFIQVTGSGDGGKEKIITDKRLREFCCCSSSELVTAINFLTEEGFICKRNLGLQMGTPASGYTIAVPEHLRGD
ncbi:transcriptional regulator [Mangrovibacter sp. SLW1]